MRYSKKELYIHIRNLLNRGQIELGTIMSVCITTSALWMFVKDSFNIPSEKALYFMPICGFCIIILQFLYGWVYDRIGLNHVDNSWMMQRNPEISEIRRILNIFLRHDTIRMWGEDMKIKSNKAKCKLCGDIVESEYRHDFKWCNCQSMFVDGGLDYIRRGGNFEDIEELSEYEEE